MAGHFWVAFCILVACLVGATHASAGDANPNYRNCVAECEGSGCVGQECFSQCKSPSRGDTSDNPWLLQWNQWNCRSDCRYHCMIKIEERRESQGDEPIKYHGKWPFKRIFGIQEPASVAFSVLNLAMHFYGWFSFISLLCNKLSKKKGSTVQYDYACLWHIYGLLSVNSWFWSAVFHTRDLDITEKLDYSSAIALIGYSLIISILRSFNVRDEASRVMVSAPLLAFVTTHILFINFYKLDYGWNMKVCTVMAVAQLLIWAIWAGVSRHPSRWKVWVVVVAGGLAMLLEIYDFPPYKGFFDAHAVWHAATVLLTYIWWSFIKDDAVITTAILKKKAE